MKTISELIISCDVEYIFEFEKLVKETCHISGVKGYKIGSPLALYYGLSHISDVVLTHAEDKILMYDHQKAGMDLPFIGRKFMSSISSANFDSVIIFPSAGIKVQREWTQAAIDYGLTPIIGGKMTQKTLMDSLVFDDDPNSNYYWQVYNIAKTGGVTNFIAPGIGDSSECIMNILDGPNITFYTPGIGSQGGTISNLKQCAPKYGKIVPIIGRAIYEASDKTQATLDFLEEMERDY